MHTHPRPTTLPSITGVILAGGTSRRMGGCDKGLMLLHGKPLTSWLLERLAPQVDTLLIVANRHLESYRAFGYPVIQDHACNAAGGINGPLAGMEVALQTATTDWIITTPVDTPLLPHNYVQRMREGSDDQPAVAWVAGRMQATHALLPRTVLPQLQHDLQTGQRRVTTWLASVEARAICWDDAAAAFCDVDTPAQLHALSDKLGRAAE